MKYLKMLGLAAIAAMALMAFVGAGTASATTLATKGVPENASVSIEATIKAGTSAILKDKNGTTTDTCTGSIVKGSTEAPYTGEKVGGTVSSLTWSGCTHTTHTLKPGTLSITWTKGTEGSVTSAGAEVTVVSTVFGASAVCSTGAGNTIGTFKGVKEGHATMEISTTTLNCGILGTSSWTGTYTVTSPTNLGVES